MGRGIWGTKLKRFVNCMIPVYVNFDVSGSKNVQIFSAERAMAACPLNTPQNLHLV